MSPAAPTVTLLRPWQPHSEVFPFETACYQCDSQLLCFDDEKKAITSRTFRALFSPGDPVSIVLPSCNREGLRIIYEAIPTLSLIPWWYGVPCSLVRVRLGLFVVGSAVPRPFTLRALLPQRELDDVPPFLRLGAEFLHANNVNVQLSSRSCEGRLLIPFTQ
jgi:hypothetical protein